VRAFLFVQQAITLTVRIISAENIPDSLNAPDGAKRGLNRSKSSYFSSSADADASGNSSSSVFSSNAKVEVELHGAPCDRRQFTMREARPREGTKHIIDQAFAAPVAEPRLALLRLSVLTGYSDGANDSGGGSSGAQTVAQTVLPVNKLRPGLRLVQLYDPQSMSDKVTQEFMLTRLLVMVNVEPLKGKASKKGKRKSRRRKPEEEEEEK
jgi:hypothetical protein